MINLSAVVKAITASVNVTVLHMEAWPHSVTQHMNYLFVSEMLAPMCIHSLSRLGSPVTVHSRL